jgi:hypothetical protein
LRSLAAAKPAVAFGQIDVKSIRRLFTKDAARFGFTINQIKD